MHKKRYLSEKVYKVDELGEEKVKVGDFIRVPKTNERFVVLETIDTNKDTLKDETQPRKNSMQAMAVAEVRDEYKRLEKDEIKNAPGFPESVITKDITIAFAGTSDARDWLTNYVEIYREDRDKFREAKGAFDSAEVFTKEIEANYSPSQGYKISLTGHSLGGAEAIYVAARNNYDAVTYAAAGPGLDEVIVDQVKSTIINIYDKRDKITSGLLADGKHNIPFTSIGIINPETDIFSHSIKYFKTDRKGNFINANGDIVIYTDDKGGLNEDATEIALLIAANKEKITMMNGSYQVYLKERLEEENIQLEKQLQMIVTIQQLHAEFETRKSEILNGHDKSIKNIHIYLDEQFAKQTISVLLKDYQESVYGLIRLFKKRIIEIDENWYNTINKAKNTGASLTEFEVKSELASVGYTKTKMLEEPIYNYENKIRVIERLEHVYNDMITTIDDNIDRLVNKDHQLAQFKLF